MLGMRRRSSLDHLESERAATKIPKEDALSIYEATLQKLRQGSRRAFVTSVEGTSSNTLPSSMNVHPNCTNPSANSIKSVEEDLEGSQLC